MAILEVVAEVAEVEMSVGEFGRSSGGSACSGGSGSNGSSCSCG